METAYPADGKIRIAFNLKEPETFDLMLRIPEWSEKTKLILNGAESVADNGYVKLTRKWSGKDCIELEEDPLAKYHLALRRGPLVLAQENRLGYSVDKPVSISVNEDDSVDAKFPEQEVAPYRHILELEIPLTNGETMHVTDDASAGKLWKEESKMAAWILVQ